MKITILDRILLLVTGVISAYQIAVGIDGFGRLPIISYTIAFGVLLIAALLMLSAPMPCSVQKFCCCAKVCRLTKIINREKNVSLLNMVGGMLVWDYIK